MPALEGRVALVTGAGQGLGRECARIFAREGARVIVADLNEETGEAAAEDIRDAGGEAKFVRTDVSSPKAVRAMIAAAVDGYGRLDCAINNAVWTFDRTPLAEISEENWNRALSINLTGVFLCMKYEIQAMLANERPGGGKGAIVNVGSGNEFGAVAGLSFYTAAKHGIYGMTKSSALDYAAKGIRINAVGPGVMNTTLIESSMADPVIAAHMLSKCPMGRIAEPSEVAEVAVWLCSDAAGIITGHTLVADGGAVLA